MSFTEILDGLPLKKSPLLQRFEALLAPKSDGALEQMAQHAHALTLQNFGRTMRLFAPLYLSNECINNCRYCGFSRDNPIFRVTLDLDQVSRKRGIWRRKDFARFCSSRASIRNSLVKIISRNACARWRRIFRRSRSKSAQWKLRIIVPIVEAGAEGLVVYQETYNREVYAEMHTSGPKRDFNWRLDCAERGYAAGFRRLGIGALFGLAPWQDEAIALAAHVDYLLKRCWQAQITVSLPRLRPAAGEFQPPFTMTDRELAQFICALRITFPQVGIVLSTRETASLRDTLVSLGVTMMSAGSHTEPGGYTHQGRERSSSHRARSNRCAGISKRRR